jgi:hypothetical protein
MRHTFKRCKIWASSILFPEDHRAYDAFIEGIFNYPSIEYIYLPVPIDDPFVRYLRSAENASRKYFIFKPKQKGECMLQLVLRDLYNWDKPAYFSFGAAGSLYKYKEWFSTHQCQEEQVYVFKKTLRNRILIWASNIFR